LLGPPPRLSFEAFVLLSTQSPDDVVEYLSNPDISMPYILTPYFARSSPEDRKLHLERLTRSANPHVRSVAASYLAMEDEDSGSARLRTAMASDVPAGWYAALSLARRGDKRAADFLVDNLEGFGLADGRVGRYAAAELQIAEQLLVLFSNSARSSGLAAPPDVRGAILNQARERYDREPAIRRWWHDVRGLIQLRDPWLEELRRLKCD
jgi:hypothetical protein